MNQGAWMGRFTADPELKTTPSGVEYCSFQLAIDRGFKDKDGNKQTDFLPFTAWRQTGVFIEKYFRRGDMIAVTGTVQSRKYEDKEGAKRTAYTIAVERAMFCGGKKQGDGTAHGSEVPPPEPPPENGIPGADDELPF
jgi:single-strand DNA-binding protein